MSEYSANISPGGIFLRTRAPQPPGTVLDLEFRLGDGFELIRGQGEVVWTRAEDEGPTRPAGMGIRFLELSPGSKELIYRIVDQHILQGGTPFDVSQIPPDPAPLVAPMSTAPPVGDVFDLPPVSAALRREPEPSSGATSWLPALDDPALEPLPPRPAQPPEPFPDLLTPPEPAEPAATPMFTTTFGAASARPRRRILPWALLAAGVVLALAVFLLRDRLMEMAGLGGGEGEEIVQTAPPAQPPRQTAPAVPLTTPAPADEESPVPAPEPAAETAPAPAPRREGVEPIPAVADTPEAPDDGAALTRLERLTFEPAPGGGTDIVLWGNGAIRPESLVRTRIDGNPPRELFRLSGIRRQFSPSRVVVGTPEVLQVRVGYHPEKGRGELHVVLDLARPNVVVAGVEPGENRLRILLRRK